MKLGPATKRDKKNKTTSKYFDDNVMSENCDVIVIFFIFGQFGAAAGRIPDRESVKVMFSVIVALCLTKTENKTKKSLIQLSHCYFE